MAELLTFLQALGENANQNQLVTHRNMLETLWERADTHAGAIKEIHAFMEYSDAIVRRQNFFDAILVIGLIIVIGLLLVILSRQEKRITRMERAVAGLDSDGEVFRVSTDDGKRLLSMTLAQIRDLVKYTGKPVDLPAGREGLITNGEAR